MRVCLLQEVLEFCFPPGVEHPKAAARLFLLCEYGPLIDGWLWGGAYNARRKLSEYEIETMVAKLEREDIINAVKPEDNGRSSLLRAQLPQQSTPHTQWLCPPLHLRAARSARMGVRCSADAGGGE